MRINSNHEDDSGNDGDGGGEGGMGRGWCKGDRPEGPATALPELFAGLLAYAHKVVKIDHLHWGERERESERIGEREREREREK